MAVRKLSLLAGMILCTQACVASEDTVAGQTAALSGADEPAALTAVVDYIAQSGQLDDLRPAMAAAGLQPRHVVAEFAGVAQGPAGAVTHIPILIGPKASQRSSIFTLEPGESTTPGYYVTDGEVYVREVTRLDGKGDLAVGDVLEERIYDLTGELVQELGYAITSIDLKEGSFGARNIPGYLDGDIVNGGEGWCWSCNAGSSWWCGFRCF